MILLRQVLVIAVSWRRSRLGWVALSSPVCNQPRMRVLSSVASAAAHLRWLPIAILHATLPANVLLVMLGTKLVGAIPALTCIALGRMQYGPRSSNGGFALVPGPGRCPFGRRRLSFLKYLGIARSQVRIASLLPAQVLPSMTCPSMQSN